MGRTSKRKYSVAELVVAAYKEAARVTDNREVASVLASRTGHVAGEIGPSGADRAHACARGVTTPGHEEKIAFAAETLKKTPPLCSTHSA